MATYELIHKQLAALRLTAQMARKEPESIGETSWGRIYQSPRLKTLIPFLIQDLVGIVTLDTTNYSLVIGELDPSSEHQPATRNVPWDMPMMHRDGEEYLSRAIIVLEGEGIVYVNGEEQVVEEGFGVYQVPNQTEYNITNTSTQKPMRFLILDCPGEFVAEWERSISD